MLAYFNTWCAKDIEGPQFLILGAQMPLKILEVISTPHVNAIAFSNDIISLAVYTEPVLPNLQSTDRRQIGFARGKGLQSSSIFIK